MPPLKGWRWQGALARHSVSALLRFTGTAAPKYDKHPNVLVVGMGIGIAIAIGIDGDTDTDPDPDPEGRQPAH